MMPWLVIAGILAAALLVVRVTAWLEAEPDATPDPAPVRGATFGPWADHAPGCKCPTCR